MKRQVCVETWRRYETGYVQLLWKVSATGKIQESLRIENYVCRTVGENVPSTESGDCCGHCGTMEARMSVESGVGVVPAFPQQCSWAYMETLGSMYDVLVPADIMAHKDVAGALVERAMTD